MRYRQPILGGMIIRFLLLDLFYSLLVGLLRNLVLHVVGIASNQAVWLFARLWGKSFSRWGNLDSPLDL